MPDLMPSNAQFTKFTNLQKAATSYVYLLSFTPFPWKRIVLMVVEDVCEIIFDCCEVLVLFSFILAANILLWPGKPY